MTLPLERAGQAAWLIAAHIKQCAGTDSMSSDAAESNALPQARYLPCPTETRKGSHLSVDWPGRPSACQGVPRGCAALIPLLTRGSAGPPRDATPLQMGCPAELRRGADLARFQAAQRHPRADLATGILIPGAHPGLKGCEDADWLQLRGSHVGGGLDLKLCAGGEQLGGSREGRVLADDSRPRAPHLPAAVRLAGPSER